MEHLDRYEREGIDEDFVEDITDAEALGARAAAERELERRDAREGRTTGRRRRLPGALDGINYLPHLTCFTPVPRETHVRNHYETCAAPL